MIHGIPKAASVNPVLAGGMYERAQKVRRCLDYDHLIKEVAGLVGTFSFCDLTFATGLRSLNSSWVERRTGQGRQLSYAGKIRAKSHLPGRACQRCTKVNRTTGE